jgi:hypothetical protein
MHWALGHFVLFGFAGAISWVGRRMWKHPEKACKVLTFGQPPNRFSIAFLRIVGQVFTVMFALGAVMYLIMIPLDLFGVTFVR